MEKLDSDIFDSMTQVRSNKKQPNESTIMTPIRKTRGTKYC